MKKTFIIAGAILLLLAAAYYYFFPGKNLLEVTGLKKPVGLVPYIPATPEDLTTKTPTSGSFVSQAPILKDAKGFPLVEGDGSLFSPNALVKTLQKTLNDVYGSTLAVDGIFGPKTARALNVAGFEATVYEIDYWDILYG